MEDWIGSLLSHKGVFLKLQPETGKDPSQIYWFWGSGPWDDVPRSTMFQ